MMNLNQYISLIQNWYLENQGYFCFLKDFDPSLLQNIILGILAIFIPFAIVFLTDILSQKNKNRSEFEKMVLSDEVLGTKKIFGLSIFGIIFFSFFSGVDITTFKKIIAIGVAIILVYLLWNPFKKVLRFSEGNKIEFEIAFLKRLKLSSLLRFQNGEKLKKMIRAWNSFWGEKTEYNEREFIDIFISHIDDNLQYNKYEDAIELGKAFLENIDKRQSFDVGYKILPKIFGWHEYLWNKEQKWLHANEIENKIENFISQKYFPTFKRWISKYTSRRYSAKNYFWNWGYFGTQVFPEIVRLLLTDGRHSYELFKVFTQYIQECEKKLIGIRNEEKRDKYFQYIKGLFSSFCPIFFDNISELQSRYEIWEHYFPRDWKISASNSEKNISHIVLYEFMEWAPERIFKKEYDDSEEKEITNLINGLFPNIDSGMFPIFLMLLFSYNDIKRTFERRVNFYILGPIVTYSGSIGDTNEEITERLGEMLSNQELSQKEETIKIIKSYFRRYWHKLRILLDDSNKKEWSSADDNKKKIMLRSAVKSSLIEMKNELESDEIVEFCSKDKLKELYRKDLLELMNLLLADEE